MAAENEVGLGGEAADDGGDACHYGPYYYEHCCGLPYDRSDDWLGLFRKFADRISGEIEPRTMLDAGCAMGLLVEAMHDRGVDAYGVDISSYAIEKVHHSVRDRCTVGSVTEPFGRRYDLIVSIEVLEHLRPEESEKAIANFCAHADDILFSSTPFDFKEASHFNVQPPEYWASLFARQGFYRDLDYDASYITRWATRYRKEKKPAYRIVTDYERKLWRLIQENHDARESLIEHQEELVQSEARLEEAKETFASATREFEARLADKDAAAESMRAEFARVLKAWSDRVHELDEKVSRQSDEMRRLRDWVAAADRLAEENDRRHQAERAALVEGRQSLIDRCDAAELALARIQSSLAWKLAHRLSSLRGRLAPTGSRRHKAARAVKHWRSSRADSAHV